MKFYFHPLADKEFDESVKYYEDCQSGLGMDFAEEVYAAIRRLSEYPDAWSEMSKKHLKNIDKENADRSLRTN